MTHTAAIAGVIVFALAGLDVPGETKHPGRREEWKAKYVRPASIPYPRDNPFTPERELLGRTLFFDPRLSATRNISCATCHNPGFAWSDGLPKAVGHRNAQGSRHTPTLMNLAWAELLFWDGRAASLEDQALGPIASPLEMNRSPEQLAGELACNAEYRTLFAKAYPGEAISPKLIARAIATFERSLVSGISPFDRWVAGDESAIGEEAKRGFDLFNSKGRCANCHPHWNFTDDGFHDIGLPDSDIGRATNLPLPSMQHAFKTPTLRNVDRRAPYMHDGSSASLEDALEFYDRGGRAKRASLDPDIVPLHLTAQEKAELLAFLHTLSSRDKPVEIPRFPR
ncbi:MAG TPA: cytochrome c peroxidase [Bryobacteraceae bacterium]|jgi:cytochrome c peroxidase